VEGVVINGYNFGIPHEIVLEILVDGATGQILNSGWRYLNENYNEN